MLKGNGQMTGSGKSLSRDERQIISLKQRLFPICYLSAVALAMVGWLWAIGWITLEAAKWLLT